jgi:hypothetical protein
VALKFLVRGLVLVEWGEENHIVWEKLSFLYEPFTLIYDLGLLIFGEEPIKKSYIESGSILPADDVFFLVNSHEVPVTEVTFLGFYCLYLREGA